MVRLSFKHLETTIHDLAKEWLFLIELTNVLWDIDSLNKGWPIHNFATVGLFVLFEQVLESIMRMRVLIDSHVCLIAEEPLKPWSCKLLLDLSMKLKQVSNLFLCHLKLIKYYTEMYEIAGTVIICM